MEHNSAKAEILSLFAGARVVRDMFGLVVVTDEDGATRMGEGRAYYEEEAWVSAVESAEWKARRRTLQQVFLTWGLAKCRSY